MTIAPFDLFLLLGALQGFILSVLLWFNPKGRRLSNQLLAGLIGLLALMSLAVGIPVANRSISLFLDLFPTFNATLVGPLLFFYTKSLLDPNFKLGKTERWHFYPVLLDWGAPLIGWTFLAGHLVGVFSRQDGSQWGQYPLYLPISVMIYWLGLKGYLHSRSSPLPEKPVAETTSKAISSWLSDDTAERILTQLQAAMQADKLYLDLELTVDKVGRHVQLPAKTVSFVLNQHLQKSFNAFVNEYRVEAVKARLADSGSQKFTIAGIAFTCGFNSQATFQRTFRQLTGMTPTEYLSRQASA